MISTNLMFVGCATDRRFVEPTAVMLTSLDVNGQVPEAAIIVAEFGLNDSDRALIRLGAGRMATNLRFLSVTREMFHEVDPDGFTDEYPPAVLGRLFVADHIKQPGARLLTLDSDMIVNTSVRPLFDLDLGSEYFAAIHDPPRGDDPNYFNSGLTLCKVDRYRYYQVARRSLQHIGEYRPHFPDQDALNAVVGDSWLRLDRLWNYFYAGGRGFTVEDYEAAKVAHFCGAKPWDHAHHPAAPIYSRYLAILRERHARSGFGHEGCGPDFVASCYEVLLGREVENTAILHMRSSQSRAEIVRDIVRSQEFTEGTLDALVRNAPLWRPDARPSLRQRLWAAEQLPVTHQTSIALMEVTARRQLLTLLLADPLMQDVCQLSSPLGQPVSSL